ncbi:MAG: OmpH family outer membrane protein [Saprospiraceae bacterium]|nr:OmpH family outer membrane protein [Saprospiraceae bacterium]
MRKISLAALALTTITFYNCKNNSATPAASTDVTKDATVPAATSGTMAAAKIVFVNIDSLKEKYTYFKQQQATFEQKERSLMAELDKKAQKFQEEYIALQEEAQKGTVPPAQLQQKGQALQARQQAIVAERDKKGKDLVEETQKFNENLQKKLNEVLATLQKQKGFDYAVSHSKGGGSPFLYVNDALDITNEVVAILNAEKK